MTTPVPASVSIHASTRVWRAVIVDDEPPARQTLRLLLGREKDFTLVAECGHGRETIDVVSACRPDVLFLDVRMPGPDGFAVLRELGPGAVPAVVFVTAYDRYAAQAFEEHAVDYLLKPFTDERFAGVVEHVRRRLRERALATLGERLPALLADSAARSERRPFVIKDGSRTHVVAEADIAWVEAEDYYIAIHANGRRILARESLKTIEARLDPAMFARVHRSAIVNTRFIKAIEPVASGDQRLLLVDGTVLRVSRTHRAALMRRL
ncbi:MAG TPA: LytTR family DNA-binding domain-containing protein [Vicinamibacterales bacterium]|jgi:two-component system LytT family response regulator